MNIHFVNLDKNTHEFCDMKQWVLAFPNSIAATMITSMKLLGCPVAFSMHGTDGDAYIVADDEAVNDPFIMAHEEGHVRLGHYDGTHAADVNGILNDENAEAEADAYAVRKTGDPRGAIETLSNMLDRIKPEIEIPGFDLVAAKNCLAVRMTKLATAALK